jgi:hypothetical protein
MGRPTTELSPFMQQCTVTKTVAAHGGGMIRAPPHGYGEQQLNEN